MQGSDISDVLIALRHGTGANAVPGVLILDEVDKVRVPDSGTGNSVAAKVNLQESLLALLAGTEVTCASGQRQIDTSRLLIVGTGAFGGLFRRPPSTDELVKWGWLREFASRWGERLCIPDPDRHQCLELLSRSERSVARRLGRLATALGLQIHVSEAALAYVMTCGFAAGPTSGLPRNGCCPPRAVGSSTPSRKGAIPSSS
jgi:ATP-dependent protease HslVU (ClpYQ) ATPase subunit